MKPYVIAIVLNWNNYNDTKECLESLTDTKYDNLDIILVDNGSSDGSATALDEEFPDIETIINDENKGFSGGMNSGIKESLERSPEYIWLLNNDIVIDSKFTLSRLVDNMESDKNLALCSPQIREYDGNEIWFQKGEVNCRTGIASHKRSSCTTVQNDYVPLAAALIRARTFDTVGYLDERFFLYYEDVDFCIRLRQVDLDVVTDCSINVLHKGSASSDSYYEPTPTYYSTRNQLLFIRKYNEDVCPPAATYWDQLKMLISRIIKGKIKAAIAVIEGVIDGIKGINGKSRYP